jgi:hypothetical protein
VKPKKKKRESKQGRPEEENFIKETGLPEHPTHLAVVPEPERHPLVATNRKDKGVAVLQIAHSPIHVAFQLIPGPG